MKINTLFLAICSLLTAVSACKDKDHDHSESPATSINLNIISPIASSEIENMDTAKINIEIKANEKLHGYNIKLVRLADSVSVMIKANDIHQNDYSINEIWVNNNTIHSDMLLTVDAITSHDGSKITKTVKFHAHKP